MKQVNSQGLTELVNYMALEQADLIRKGEVSSVELTTLYLDRIAQHNDALNAFVTVHGKQAIKAATQADQERREGHEHAKRLFHGVPTGLKDLVPTKWSRTQLGSRAFKFFISPFDGTVVKRMNAGGFLSLGKLATSEFGVLPVTEPDIHPPTRTPWNLDHSAGGSSGGSGSAVAAGLLPIAQGSDGGGSVRIPSAFCHLYGFKPSISLLGNLHGPVNKLGACVMGPLAHSVADAAAMLDVMAGRPYGGSEDESCLAMMEREPGQLKIHMVLESSVGPVDPHIAEATRNAGRLLESLGHVVTEVSTIPASVEEFLPVWRLLVQGVPVLSDKVLQPVTRWLREPEYKTTIEQARAAQALLVGRIHEIFGDADILLSPTVAMTPPRISAFEDADPARWFDNAAQAGALTAVFNLTTGPAATLPLGLSDDGLPYGIQIGSRLGNDGLVLALSRQIEAACPWIQRRPPVFWD